MSVILVTGATSEQASFNALKQITPSKETFVVVPDRATLQIEEMLFDALNISSTFNINVVGIGNLASKHVPFSLALSEIESILYIKKAIENKKSELKYFQSTNVNFCKEVYKVISQFSSSSIEPSDIQPTDSSYANKKIQDLKIIFEEFKALTSEFDDPSEILDKFACKIKEEGLFKGADFFFVGFDSFTSKHYKLIEALFSTADKICLSCAKPISKGNSYIYDDDIFEKVKNLAQKNQINVEVISLPCELEGGAKIICEHLFANDDYSENCNDVRIFEGKTKNEECEFVAKTIAYEVYHGARYRDFVIAASPLSSYQQPLRFAFEKNNIPCYFDSSCVAGQTYMALLFKKILLFSYKNFNKDDLMFILSSPLICGSEIVTHVAESYEASAKNFFALSKIDDFKILVKEIMQNYLAGAKKLIEFLIFKSESLDGLNLDEKTLNMENQIPNLLSQIVESYEKVYQNGTFQEFISAIELGLENTEISALPSYYDEVYVGDANDSYFTNCKKLFVVGANAGALPKVTADDSILSDSELLLPAFTKSVEPTIKMINRRSRAKIFELLCSFKDELFVTYSLVGEGSKPIARSMILEQLIDIFNKKDRILRDLEPNSVADKDMLLFCLGKSAESAKELAGGASDPQVRGLIEKVLRLNKQKFDRFKDLKSAKKLKLGQVVRPTEIEKFYDCPFKLYCENILKLKQKDLTVLSPLDRGSIIHDLLEEYGKKYQFKSIPNFDKFVENKVEKAFDFSNLPDGDFVKKQLIDDAKKICLLVQNENATSPYEAWQFEKEVSAVIGGASVYGRVDRIDKAGNVFRIIDYKTGKVTSNLIKDMAYGRKLQLFVYAKIIGEQSGLKCGGIYYFKNKAGYNNDEKVLVGLTTENGKAYMLDKKYLSDDEFNSLTSNAEQLIKRASTYLKEGKLYPSPDGKSCEFCPYKSICLYDSQKGTRLHGGGEE